ncbi:uncharacterized protein LOC107715451 [Sinocyclocheilus rhinocerous]|uniref:uncharacterized protein LOC107715451 n=1 Tax=Sinocyclocheilus rhinocerous TaxID=307959 RepID=UPI0007B7D2F6|nr:PREDICTED: uncharacterized protein LOC107715451 [Sinocyclocheilus rhinocerous]
MELISGSLSQILPRVPQRGDFQNLQKIKPVEISNILHAQLSETDKVGNSASEKLQRLYLQNQQQHGSSRHQLVTLLKELELLETPLTAQGQNKAKHQTQEAHIAAAITWWRGQTKEGKKNQAAQVPQETVMDIQKRIQSLEVNHIPAQLEETKRCMRVLLKDQGTSTCDDTQIQFRDVAVVTDSSAERSATEDLLKSLRKVEDMVTQALRAAQVLMGSEKRMKERIEAIGMRVERALSRAEATESQLNALEATISANTQSLCMSQSKGTGLLVDCGSAAITFFTTPEPVAQESVLTPLFYENELYNCESIKYKSLVCLGRSGQSAGSRRRGKRKYKQGFNCTKRFHYDRNRELGGDSTACRVPELTLTLTASSSGHYGEWNAYLAMPRHMPAHLGEDSPPLLPDLSLRDKGSRPAIKNPKGRRLEEAQGAANLKNPDNGGSPTTELKKAYITRERLDLQSVVQAKHIRITLVLPQGPISRRTSPLRGFRGRLGTAGNELPIWRQCGREGESLKEVLKTLMSIKRYASFGGSLLCTRAEDHSNKVSRNPDATLLDQDPGSPSELWLKRADSVCLEPVSAGLPSVGAITLQSPALLCTESSLPEPSACEEPTPHNRQENVAGLDWPASNDSFLSESEAIRNTLAVNEETCRSQNKEETGCAGAELQNSRGRTESSGRCHKSEHSSRTEALKLLNRGQTSKSADVWDNHGFSLSEETQVEDTGRCQDGREDSDCTGRSQEESESSGQSQARTGNSETQEESKTSDSDTSKSPSVQATDLTDNPGDQEDPTAVCQFTRSRAEQTSLKRAYSFVTESVTDFIFPHTRSRPPLIPAMPTLPEEEEDSPEELNSTSSSPSTCLWVTALSPNPTPCSSPRPSRSSSLSSPSQLGPEVTTTPPASPSIAKHLEVPSTHDQGDTSKPEQETFTRLVDWMPSDKRKVSSGPLTVRYSTAVPARDPAVVQKEKPDHHGPADKGKNSEHAAQKKEETSGCGITGVAKPVPRPPTQQAPCTAEIKTIGAFPPLMRAVSWDTVGSINMRNAAPKGEDSLSDKSRESLFKSSGYKDFPVPPGNVQKLSKLREEHKLMRNQSISSPKLPDLSETTEQERGMNSNAFVQLSLAFRNDNYTLESRLKQAERERSLTEENAEKELEEFKSTLKNTVSLWQNIEQREFYQHLLETIAVLYRLTNRLSSRAEMVGAVRQEKRMNKATEVMMQYVENLKRTYEKDRAELMEFKKVASQNSSRCYAGSVDTGEDGVPRTSRSMSVQMGKALPRRRVSVAVVPKFNLLNIPGQTPAAAGPNAGPLPVVCEANTIKNSSSSDPTQQDVPDKSSGNPLTEQESEATPTKVVCSPEKVTEEIKAKIEEAAYNKGYQEGLKRSKELQELKEEEEKAEEKPKDSEEEARGNTDKDRKTNSRFEEALEVFDRIFPKFFRGNRVLWIVLTLFFTSFILVNVISFFSNRYSESGDTSAEKSAVPGKTFFGLNVGSKTPAPE